MGYWEVQLGGQWKSLGRVVGEACQKAKDRGATQVKFTAHGHEYLIDIPQMIQQNIKSGKQRPIRIRHRDHIEDGRSGGVHVHKPAAPAPAAPSAPPAAAPAAVPGPAPEKAGGGGIGIMGGMGLMAGMAAAGTGIAVAAGVVDIGDITDAATAAGDAIGDVAGDAADAIADAAADVQDLM
jgi:hypothetical protein